MGVVYKAEDCELKRTVALKFLVPRMIQQNEDKERFLREAQAAASLNHPHICTIYQIEETEGNTFIAMEYIEGQSLKEIAGKHPLKPEKALDFAIQIAEGLEEAHEKKIVHRDIKSANIMITPKSQAKIMDFGLAKIVSESQLAETASIMGTVAYMSPEQACGEAVDHRSDIWSLGVVLYEMLSGHLPFHEEHEQLVLHSILNKDHEPLSAWRSDIPYELERIVDKCLEKKPADRYQRVKELLKDLQRFKKETESGIVVRTKPVWTKKRAKKLKKLIMPIFGISLSVVMTAGFFLFDWFKTSPQWQTSIAVLPVRDGNISEKNQILCVGITKDLIIRLTKYSSELRVVPYDSVRNYINTDKDTIEICKGFDVENALVASLVTQGEEIQLYAELIDVKTNRNIHVVKQEFSKSEIFTVQDDISKEVVSRLGLRFNESGVMEAQRREPENVEAYKYYIQGMDLIERMDSFPDLEQWYAEAMRIFDRAIVLDPHYALAYWGKGSVLEAYYVKKKEKKDLELMFELYERAYELDPELAETNLALGWANFYKEDLEKAASSFRKALDIEAQSALVNCDVGAFLSSIGFFPSAIKYYEKSSQVESSYARAYELSALCHWYIGKFEDAIEKVSKAIELEENHPGLYLASARSLIMLKEYDKAEREIAEAERIQPWLSSLEEHKALLFAAKGDKKKALQLLEEARGSYRYAIACGYSLLGMTGQATANIQLGIDIGFEKEQLYLYPYLFLEKNPCFDLLRSDPEFMRILENRRRVHEQRRKEVKVLL